METRIYYMKGFMTNAQEKGEMEKTSCPIIMEMKQ